MVTLSSDGLSNATQESCNIPGQYSWSANSETKVHKEYYSLHQSHCDYDAVYIRRSIEIDEHQPRCVKGSYACNEFLESMDCLAMLGSDAVHSDNKRVEVVKLDCSRLSDIPHPHSKQRNETKSPENGSQLGKNTIEYEIEGDEVTSENRDNAQSVIVELMNDTFGEKGAIVNECTSLTNSPSPQFKNIYATALAITDIEKVELDNVNFDAELDGQQDAITDNISKHDVNEEGANNDHDNSEKAVDEEVKSEEEYDMDEHSEYTLPFEDHKDSEGNEKETSSLLDLSFLSHEIYPSDALAEEGNDASTKIDLKEHDVDDRLDVLPEKVTVELGSLEPNVLQNMKISSKKDLTREFLRQQTTHFELQYLHLVPPQQEEASSPLFSGSNIYHLASAPTFGEFDIGTNCDKEESKVKLDSDENNNEMAAQCNVDGNPDAYAGDGIVEQLEGNDESTSAPESKKGTVEDKAVKAGEINKLKSSHLINRVVTIKPKRSTAVKRQKQKTNDTDSHKGKKKGIIKQAKAPKGAQAGASNHVDTKKAAVANPLLHEQRHSIDLRKDMMYKKFLEAFQIKKNGKLLKHIRVPSKKAKVTTVVSTTIKQENNMALIETPTSTSNELAIYTKDKNDSDESGYNDGNNGTEVCSASGAGGDSSTTLMDLPSSDAMEESDFVNLHQQNIPIIPNSNLNMYLKKHQQQIGMERNHVEDADLAQRFMENIMGRYSTGRDLEALGLGKRNRFYTRALPKGHDISKNPPRPSDPSDPIVCLSLSGREHEEVYTNDGDNLQRYNSVKSNGKPTKQPVDLQPSVGSMHTAMYISGTPKSQVFLQQGTLIGRAQRIDVNAQGGNVSVDNEMTPKVSSLKDLKSYGSRSKTDTGVEPMSLDDMLAAAAYLEDGECLLVENNTSVMPFEKRRKCDTATLGSDAYNDHDGDATSYANKFTRHHGMDTPTTYRAFSYSPRSNATSEATLRESTPTTIRGHINANAKRWYESQQGNGATRDNGFYKSATSLQDHDAKGGDLGDKVFQRGLTPEKRQSTSYQQTLARRRIQDHVREQTRYLADRFLNKVPRYRDYDRVETDYDSSHRQQQCMSPRGKCIPTHGRHNLGEEQDTSTKTGKSSFENNYKNPRFLQGQCRHQAYGNNNYESSRANGNPLYLTRDYFVENGIVTNRQTCDDYRYGDHMERDDYGRRDYYYKPTQHGSRCDDTPISTSDYPYMENSSGGVAICDNVSQHSDGRDTYYYRDQYDRSNYSNTNDQQNTRGTNYYSYGNNYNRRYNGSFDRSRRYDCHTNMAHGDDDFDGNFNNNFNMDYGYDYYYNNNNNNDRSYSSVHGQQRGEPFQNRRSFDSNNFRIQDNYGSPRNYGYNAVSNRSNYANNYSRQAGGRDYYYSSVASNQTNYTRDREATFYNDGRFPESPKYAPGYPQGLAESPRYRHKTETHGDDKYYNGSQPYHQGQGTYRHVQESYTTHGSYSPHSYHQGYSKRNDYCYYQPNAKTGSHNNTRHWT